MNIKRLLNVKKIRRRKWIIMATQLAPTPVLYGVEARDVINELNKKASKKSIENGNKLVEFFKQLEEK